MAAPPEWPVDIALNVRIAGTYPLFLFVGRKIAWQELNALNQLMRFGKIVEELPCG